MAMGCRGVESVSMFGVEVSRPGLRPQVGADLKSTTGLQGRCLWNMCPYDIKCEKWSVPIPFVDFVLCEKRVFETVRHPKAEEDQVDGPPAWQRVWHWSWLLLIAGSVVGMVGLRAVDYFTGGATDHLPTY